MDPHLPFLKAIAADPADDLPRLVYADFLEETEEPVHVARAHFIRTQIALETLRPKTREYREAKALEQRLYDSFEYHWLLDLPEYLQKQDRVTWRRGFPDGVRVGFGLPDDWGAAIRPDWFETLPIQSVHIPSMWGPGVARWLNAFDWPKVTRLRLGPNFIPLVREDEEDTQVYLDLMTHPGLSSVCALDLSENRLTDRWLVRFVSHFPTAAFSVSLEELDFSNCHSITDAGANTLATARGLDRLKVLRLSGVTLSPDSVAMLRRRFGSGLQI